MDFKRVTFFITSRLFSSAMSRDFPMLSFAENINDRSLTVDRLRGLKFKTIQLPVPPDHPGVDPSLRT
jgi:hypothetical protein